eukprot:GHVR01166304.1.p1 GENE.GHVR01166304.1~~GHVR01166304.1.p1  ORF type:complete len:122 (+),score=29.19 GHVR01166304.1:25-390(+)
MYVPQGGMDLPHDGKNQQMDQEQRRRMEEQKAMMEERRRQCLQARVAPEALQRLNRLALVKPEKSRKVEDFILNNFQGTKFSDDELRMLLEKLDASQENKCVSVSVQRRKQFDDDDYWNDD